MSKNGPDEGATQIATAVLGEKPTTPRKTLASFHKDRLTLTPPLPEAEIKGLSSRGLGRKITGGK